MSGARQSCPMSDPARPLNSTCQRAGTCACLPIWTRRATIARHVCLSCQQGIRLLKPSCSRESKHFRPISAALSDPHNRAPRRSRCRRAAEFLAALPGNWSDPDRVRGAQARMCDLDRERGAPQFTQVVGCLRLMLHVCPSV